MESIRRSLPFPLLLASARELLLFCVQNAFPHLSVPPRLPKCRMWCEQMTTIATTRCCWVRLSGVPPGSSASFALAAAFLFGLLSGPHKSWDPSTPHWKLIELLRGPSALLRRGDRTHCVGTREQRDDVSTPRKCAGSGCRKKSGLATGSRMAGTSRVHLPTCLPCPLRFLLQCRRHLSFKLLVLLQ